MCEMGVWCVVLLFLKAGVFDNHRPSLGLVVAKACVWRVVVCGAEVVSVCDV